MCVCAKLSENIITRIQTTKLLLHQTISAAAKLYVIILKLVVNIREMRYGAKITLQPTLLESDVIHHRLNALTQCNPIGIIVCTVWYDICKSDVSVQWSGNRKWLIWYCPPEVLRCWHWGNFSQNMAKVWAKITGLRLGKIFCTHCSNTRFDMIQYIVLTECT